MPDIIKNALEKSGFKMKIVHSFQANVFELSVYPHFTILTINKFCIENLYRIFLSFAIHKKLHKQCGCSRINSFSENTKKSDTITKTI